MQTFHLSLDVWRSGVPELPVGSVTKHPLDSLQNTPQVARSEVLLDVDANAREAASTAPEVMLAGAVPRLIDEWRVVPSIWNHIRRAVDDRKAAGHVPSFARRPSDTLWIPDNTGLEVDAIVESASGAWAAFEIKLGHAQVDEAASHLLTFADRIDTAVSGRPATMGVIVGTGIGYVRPDGVAVIPIGALGP